MEIFQAIHQQVSILTGFPGTFVLESCHSGVVCRGESAHKAAQCMEGRSQKHLCFVTLACCRISFTRCLTDDFL